jgi:hypothetical protein
MAVNVQFQTSKGGDPVRLVTELTGRVLPDGTDLEFALEQQRTRILERTARGVDFEEKPFAPYSQNGPVYYYASTQRGRSFFPGARRLQAIWAGRSTFRAEYFKVLAAAAQRFARKVTPNGGTTPGGGVKFESYAAFKAALGRGVVDLMGPRAPHMLQALLVRMRTDLEGAIGIYGTEAARASGHHDGNPKTKLPRRRFLGANGQDRQQVIADIVDRVAARARERLGE